MTSVYAGRVLTEGDELYYEVRGEGPPLLMISGGGGDAGYYSQVADILADEYTVITYDRRGNSRSTRNEPQNFEVSQQARDAVAVMRAAGHQSAIVFGNSGGAIFALEMARNQPQALKAVVVHEPPVVRMLPDSEQWLRFFAGVYGLAYRYGVTVAMFRFLLSLGIPLSALGKTPKDVGARLEKNNEFLVKHEMIPSVTYRPDVERIKGNGVKVFMAAGQVTLDKQKYYGRTAPILADLLGCELVTFPGHHNSYIDLPQEWTATLRSVLHKVGS
ncbi:MAG TPA: alpha/beta hydrolase [Symbiobacteriaceae bacterium]|nr:alpha/beta hydrolase [Symbiobacteriaceae bacterium]